MNARTRSVRGGRARALPLRVLPATLLCAVAASLLCVPAPARADIFAPISLVSEGTLAGGELEQAEYAHDPAISGNGQYVAFDGSVGGVTGVWRRDVATGAIEKVAGGDAELPSISQDGQYISFTTNEGKSLPTITYGSDHEGPRGDAGEQEAVNVYVRDMAKGPEEQGAFIVASAPNGSAEGLTYSGAGTTLGATAVGRSAISADGNEVAFVTTAVSDLSEGTPAEPKTPKLQVAVRYLDNDQTVLVSGEYEPLTGQTTDRPASVQEGSETFGAVYPGNAPSFGPPPANGKWGKNPPAGASISADGSTVAWMGEDIGKQARMLPEESPPPLYTEPLWRRIAPGSQTPTERVTGGSDPANPACVASGEAALPPIRSPSDPCQGPFEVTNETGNRSSGIWTQGGTAQAEGDFVPRLSADGYTVAFISGALPVAFGGGFGDAEEGEPADLYVADMHAGLTREQALTPLTELASAETVAGADPITDFDISPDGDQVAFTTRRTEFPLGSPAYVSDLMSEPGLSELFDVDLSSDTLTRVTHGYEGGPSEQPHGSKLLTGREDAYGQSEYFIGAQSPSFSADGHIIAFASTASNLVFGDGNTPPAGPLDGSDAFLIEREVFAAIPTPQYISPPPETGTAPSWRLGVTALSRRDGSVLLYVAAPGAGTLRAGARGSVLVKASARSAKRARASRVSRKGHARETVAARTVATSTKLIRGGGEVVELALKLAKPYAQLASRSGGLSASVNLTFTAPGHSTLRQSIDVTFLRTILPARSSGKSRTATRRRGGRR